MTHSNIILTKRIFMYENRKLNDPDPSLTPEEVRDIYCATYPELATAVIEGPNERVEVDGVDVYDFRKSVGTKS